MSDYRSHLFRAVGDCGLPERVLYLDTETRTNREGDTERHTMRLAWTCYCLYDQRGKCRADDWVLHRDRLSLNRYIASLAMRDNPLVLFGHNIFFDLQAAGFFLCFTEWKWNLRFYYDSGMVYILVIRKAHKSLKCLSTTNYFDAGLKELGKMVGLPKFSVDFDTVSLPDLITYCRRDVEILRRVVEVLFGFILKHRLGGMALTKAGQSMRAFRHRFMKKKIYIHNEEKVRELERLCYLGGRTECFQIGCIKGGPFVTLDVNSMYSYIMSRQPVPTHLLSYQENVSLQDVRSILKGCCVCAEVELDTDQPLYALKTSQKVLFPVGCFIAYLNTPALSLALSRGHIRRVLRLAAYEPGVIFGPFVRYFYPLKQAYRKAGERVNEEFVKKLLNAQYGRWAMMQPIEESNEAVDKDGYYRKESWDAVTGKSVIEYQLFNRRVVLFGTKDSKDSFPAIAGHITEGARLHLGKIIERIGYGRVLYCDTDSVKIRTRDIERARSLIHPDKLGMLKEEKNHRKLRIIAPKSYITEHTRVLKGIPKSAQLIAPDTYHYHSFLRQTTHMREGDQRSYMVRDTIKRLSGTYDKGVVHADGHVTPFRLVLSRPLSEQLQLSV